MGEEELLGKWAERLWAELYPAGIEYNAEQLGTIQRVLHEVFLVGVQTGKDEAQTERQLQEHGKPYGTGQST